MEPMGSMRIAVMGSGGIGGYFGAKLARAGHHVEFVARGPHLAAIRAHGLRVRGDAGDFVIAPARATDDPADIGPVDVVIFAVKLYDTERAGALCQPLIGPDTAVITFQNGVTAIDILATILGRGHLLGGVANISAIIEAPGVIRHFDSLQVLRFGELDNSRSARVTAFHAACEDAGIEAHILEETTAALWDKFVFLTAVSGANCLTREPVGPLRENAETRALLETLIDEAIAVARARGVGLPDDEKRVTMDKIDALPAAMKASMLVALERGERLEIEGLSGAVAAMGAALGVPTPAHRTVAAALSLASNPRAG